VGPGEGRGRPRAGAGALGLLAACHPEAAATVTVLVGLLALGAGAAARTAWIVTAVAAGQLGVGWSNDYLDRGRDLAAGRGDKPIATGRVTPGRVGRAALLALVACVPLSLAAGPGFAAAHLAAVAAALAYNAGLKALPVSPLPYLVAFGLVPVAVALAAHGRPPPLWAIVAGASIGVGGHCAQALPDLATARRTGERGLPQLLGERATAPLAAALLLAADAAVTFGPGPPGPPGLAGAALAAALSLGVVAAAGARRPRLAFRLALAVAAMAVLTFLARGGSL
jgi:4-hydroxybenzoate polyprenyltransferase